MNGTCTVWVKESLVSKCLAAKVLLCIGCKVYKYSVVCNSNTLLYSRNTDCLSTVYTSKHTLTTCTCTWTCWPFFFTWHTCLGLTKKNRGVHVPWHCVFINLTLNVDLHCVCATLFCSTVQHGTPFFLHTLPSHPRLPNLTSPFSTWLHKLATCVWWQLAHTSLRTCLISTSACS